MLKKKKKKKKEKKKKSPNVTVKRGIKLKYIKKTSQYQQQKFTVILNKLWEKKGYHL